MKGKPRVFLSHSHIDKRKVRRLAHLLELEGIKVWIDEGEIYFGDSLVEKLSNAIAEVDIVLAFLSEDSVRSEWVKRELDLAMNHEIKQKRVKVIPVAIERVQLPGFLEGKLYADFSNAYRQKKNFPWLKASILKHFGG